MEDPEPALAPVIPPEMAPRVQAKLLAILDVREIFGLDPLQIVAVLDVVTMGIGSTATVMAKGAPTQDPVVAVGVTLYWTDPGLILLGLVST